ncbi:mitochondrial translation release factor in rescue-like [Macrosteles quadrilineatus]|uniref:mitochondrial translation release factor in rescue-like n=1 Tax=Macrosteles quadrilineatus TaxID=74068 RepID=UPI0023E2B310|nr:mitochondrial translation release factor in rescue-like [Macrosteles quadrilineatus]XP_054287431.1 mitochondrial translation release factor in rescue-like [Macrosteles quadrilineatus]
MMLQSWSMVRRLVTTVVVQINKNKLDYSLVPKLVEEDLKEQFVRGSGPGGQATNRTSNCVVLTHKPSGIVVKCHETRSQDRNRKLAREILVTKLDNLINGDKSIEAQTKALEKLKTVKADQKRKKLAKLKDKWKEQEGIT